MGRLDPAQEAGKLLITHNIAAIPVPVATIARDSKIQLVLQPLEDDVSGVLYRDGTKIVMGVNSRHAPTRRRFTIAHELGHWSLHAGRDVHVDRATRVNFRHQQVWGIEEVEANRFAANLLMPRWAFTPDLVQALNEPGTTLPAAIHRLSVTFRVSQQAMQFRLTELGILDPA